MARLVRVEVHGEPWWNIHQRSGSAPRESRIVQGSMTLPRLFDIFRRSASTIWPRARTWRYGTSPCTRLVDGEQRVEPASRLVDGLADELGRDGEALSPSPLRREAPLGRRHRARIEPGVDDGLDAARLPAAFRAGEGDLVDAGRCGSRSARSVPASSESSASEATQRWWPSATAPDRKRRPPVAVAGQRPVDVVLPATRRNARAARARAATRPSRLRR